METLVSQPLPVFQVLGTEDQTLQLLLMQGHAIRTNRNFIAYCSPKLSIRTHRSCNALLTPKLHPMNCTIRNQRGQAEYLGLNKPLTGKVLGLQPLLYAPSLVVRTTSVLAHSESARDRFASPQSAHDPPPFFRHPE